MSTTHTHSSEPNWAKTGYVLTQPDAVQASFRTGNSLSRRPANYNLRPGMAAPFIWRNTKGANWIINGIFGFVPPWEQDLQKGVYPHARAEAIQTTKSFCNSFKVDRCLIVADGFFVWNKKNQPHFVRLVSRKLFGVAGFFAVNRNINPPLTSFAILTIYPNTLIMDVHHRMPVIIRPEDEDRYLDPATPLQDVLDLLQPFDESEMEMYRVSPKLNTATDNSSNYIRPLATRNSLTSITPDQEVEQLPFL